MRIIREDPPGSTGSGKRPDPKYIKIAEKLKADPGNWYKVAERQNYPELTNRIKRGLIIAFAPRETFEATARRVDGTYTIYARYVGDAS